MICKCGHSHADNGIVTNDCDDCECFKFEPQEGPIKTNTSEDKNAPSINCECGHIAEIHLAGTGACQQPFCFPDARHNKRCSCQKFKLEESPAEASQLSCRVPPSGGEIGALCQFGLTQGEHFEIVNAAQQYKRDRFWQVLSGMAGSVMTNGNYVDAMIDLAKEITNAALEKEKEL